MRHSGCPIRFREAPVYPEGVAFLGDGTRTVVFQLTPCYLCTCANQEERRMLTRTAVLITAAVVLAFIVAPAHGQPSPTTSPASRPAGVVETARAAAKQGKLLFQLTTPDELKSLLGPPKKEHPEKDGDSQALILEYPGLHAVFSRSGGNAPFTLFKIALSGTLGNLRGESLDIGAGRPVTLRNADDLTKVASFSGLANIYLVNVDLTQQESRLNQLHFDSRTQWPPADKLPRGFDPAKLLEDGKNPGLGVRKLHERGIDGRGIHIAIIDQPLLREHREYQDRVVQYEPIDVAGVPPQMHGSPVTSIAVGKSCGTAPGASVHYYAVPTWKWWEQHCKPYAAVVDRIVAENEQRPAGQKVQVVSISLGAFSQWPDHQLWVDAVKRAADAGVLVVSCDSADLRIAILKRNLGQDPESPSSYSPQAGSKETDRLGVPAGNRTTAFYSDPDDYMFWRDGGMSWTVPYLAGLAALACQVDPAIQPHTIVDLWLKTAQDTPAGRVIDPPAFIDAVQKAKGATKPPG
jgi:hypothetical protein